MDFAQKLLQLMAHRRITQEALGDALGVSHVAVGKWLRGAKPRAVMGQRLATFFGVPPDSLLDDNRGLPDEVTSTYTVVSLKKQKIGEAVVNEAAEAYLRDHPEQFAAIAASLQGLLQPLQSEIREMRESLERLERKLDDKPPSRERLAQIKGHASLPGPAVQPGAAHKSSRG